jgi:Flp pilus assembly protein TadG
MTAAARIRRQPRGDEGAATIFVVALSVMLFVVAGLVVDGGLAINARGRAADDAEQAARAGAQKIDVETLRATGQVVLNQAEAAAAAQEFLAGRPTEYAPVAVQVEGNVVTVQVHTVEDTAILGLIGINQFDVNAAASSEPVVGID